MANELGALEIQPLTKLPQPPNDYIVHFPSQEACVNNAIREFLATNDKEPVLILIDVLLISRNTSSPTLDQYKSHLEFSCELYADLLRTVNGKYQNEGISGDKLNFIIYSRSDAILSVISPCLKEICNNESKDSPSYLPMECYLPKNISWCKNLEEEAADDEPCKIDNPLALPKNYVSYIASL